MPGVVAASGGDNKSLFVSNCYAAAAEAVRPGVAAPERIAQSNFVAIDRVKPLQIMKAEPFHPGRRIAEGEST